MHVATQSQIARIMRNEQEGDLELSINAQVAAQTINDILDNWGSMNTKNSRACADRLRSLADLVDGLETATGQENTYYY